MTKRNIIVLFVLLLTITLTLTTHAQTNDQWLDDNLDQLVDLYKYLHANPELSFHEEKTAAHLANILKDLGYNVTTNIGGYGVVAILKNGQGNTVMFRADMDALPIIEQTGLPYASTVTTKNDNGIAVGVMHACGHDIHMTNLIGLATYLAQHKSKWQGTAMLVLQPAEERGAGAIAMLNDGLFTRFKKPDYALGLHVATDTPANFVKYAPGPVCASVDMVDITLFGRGGHGAYPHTAIDPVAMAATLVVDLQSIVAREINPTSPAVITVGSIHGGTKHNIIPDSCHLQITVRSYSEKVRNHLLDAIQRKADTISQSYRATKPPLIKIRNESTPPVINDPALTKRMKEVFDHALGQKNVKRFKPQMGGEDFAYYGQAGVTACFFRVGTIDPDRHAKMKTDQTPFPSAHSALFYPDPKLTLKTSLTASTASMIDLLQPEK